jgi:hypothetical protein
MIGGMGSFRPQRRACVAIWLAVSMGLGAAGCGDPRRKMEQKQRQRDAEKKAFEEAKQAQLKAAMPKLERARLEAPWAAPAYLEVTPGRPCPEGVWALFPDTPGEGDAKQANEARRADLLAKVRSATFVAVLPLGGAVAVGRYDARKKSLGVEIDGVLECFDGLGLMSFALAEPARPFRPPPSDEPGASLQAVWRAPKVVVEVPFASAAEAKDFTSGRGTGLEARVVFTAGKVSVDTKLVKPKAAAEGETPQAEVPIDWGAGRLVHGELIGVRLGVDHEKVEVAVRLKK